MAGKWLTKRFFVSAHLTIGYPGWRTLGANFFMQRSDEEHGESLNFGVEIGFWWRAVIIQAEWLNG